MIKKYWKLAVLLAAVAVMAIGVIGSGAWFTDFAKSTDNTLTAGTLDLKVNGQNDVSQTYMLQNLKPSAWDLAGQAVLKNDGTMKGHLWLEIVNVKNNENGCTDPETRYGDTSCETLQGELGSLVKASFQENQAPWTRFGGTDPINTSAGQHVDIADLEPGQSYPLVVYAVWTADGAADNLAQNDSVTFDVIFHLDQVH